MSIKIGNYILSENHPSFIVAEISGNHDGSIDNALKLVHSAKNSGANAIKLQTYTADTITINSDKEDFILGDNSPWSSFRTLWNVYNKAHTPWEWHQEIFSEAKRLGLEYFSSPFDASAVDFLENLDVCAYKIASPEVNDIPLLRKVAQKKKPIIVSTGIATKSDIELCLNTLRDGGASDIIVLKCTTAYPAPTTDLNLLSIPMIKKDFKCNVGFSDHSLGIVAPVVAVAMGAVIIEKHIKSNSGRKTVDSEFSSSEEEFKSMVDAVREAENAIGLATYNLPESVKLNYNGGRSLYVSAPISKGDKLTPENISSFRPGLSLHTKYYDKVIGSIAKQDLSIGDRISWDVIQTTYKK